MRCAYVYVLLSSFLHHIIILFANEIATRPFDVAVVAAMAVMAACVYLF